MDKNLYEKMQTLLELKGSVNSDIKYLGSISVPVNTKNR